jgi:ubiquinone biosynthesis protein
MTRIFQIFRLFRINTVLMRHAFTRQVLGPEMGMWRFLSYFNLFSFLPTSAKTRGESIRIALEELGPIFVKFGQLLSTRRDLIPEDIADELAKLQDRVPPFPTQIAIKIIEKSFQKRLFDLFAQFDGAPLASASIAQVHAAKLHDSSEVVVKVLRPNIGKIIRQDIGLLYIAAQLTERFWRQGKRLRLIALVAEFEKTIFDELDLLREAASASQLRRNFIDSDKMYVPKIYWNCTHENVMVMERIYGIPIADIAALKARNTNMKKLAEYGVEIFFTQVFRDSFFHADMHPGNLFVDVRDPENPKYLGVDFGIMGTLSPSDQRYLAENLVAFFYRDYRKVALLHIESGWLPPTTRVDEFESAIRTVCEPIFERPLKDISFGQLLLRLFQTVERFHMEVQPQLMLLQKTLLSIEGLGRQLYPDLDLWTTAKPFMTRWIKERRSLKHVLNASLQDWQETTIKALKSPQLLYDVFHEVYQKQNLQKYQLKQSPIKKAPRKRRYYFFGAGLALGLTWLANLLTHHSLFVPTTSATWFMPVLAGLLLILGFVYRSR